MLTESDCAACYLCRPMLTEYRLDCAACYLCRPMLTEYRPHVICVSNVDWVSSDCATCYLCRSMLTEYRLIVPHVICVVQC